jgi:hypothetical protein
MIKIDLDLYLLKLMLTYVNYEAYSQFIEWDSLSEEARCILSGLTKWYEEMEITDCDLKKFVPWFFANLHANWMPDEQEYYKHIFSKIIDIKNEEIYDVLKQLRLKKLWQDLKKIRDRSFDTIQMAETIASFNERDEIKDEDIFTTDIREAEEILNSGGEINWRLKGMNEIVGPIGKGVFVLAAAYQNKGKSAFAISEAAYMARQLADEKRVLYFNNEEHNSRLLYRIYAAVIGKPINVILDHKDLAVKRYTELVGGDRDKILLFNVYGKSFNYIESKCKQYNAGLIIIDQLDNILSGKKLESARPYKDLYERARNLSNKYAPVLGLSQAAGNTVWKDKNTQEEIYQEWLGESQLHWSKVDKQGATDVLLTIGVDNKIKNQRNIWVHRCKMNGRSGKFVCLMNANTMRIED